MVTTIDDASPVVRIGRQLMHRSLATPGTCVSGLVTGDDRNTQVEGIPVFGSPAEALDAIDLLPAEVSVSPPTHTDNWFPVPDLKTIVRTARAVLRGKGAC